MSENESYNQLVELVQEAINRSPNKQRIASMVEALGHRTLRINPDTKDIDITEGPTVELSFTVE